MLDFSNEQIFMKFCIHRADKGKKRQNFGKDQDRILDAKKYGWIMFWMQKKIPNFQRFHFPSIFNNHDFLIELTPKGMSRSATSGGLRSASAF